MRLWSTIFVTEGHMAAGIREKAMPSITIGMIGVRLVSERIRWTRTSKRDPYTITLALFPFVSVNQPNKGVKRMVPKYTDELIIPLNFSLKENLFCNRSGAYFMKGNTAE